MYVNRSVSVLCILSKRQQWGWAHEGKGAQGGKAGPHTLWPKALPAITSPRSWSVWKVIITIIKKKGLRGDCHGIVVCVSFVPPQWHGARSQAVEGQQSRSFRKQTLSIQPGCLSSRIMLQPTGAQSKQKSRGVMGEAGGQTTKQWLPAAYLLWPGPAQRTGATPASNLHGALALTLLVVWKVTHTPCFPDRMSENRFGPWHFSSTAMKESGIPHSDFSGLLGTFPFTWDSLCESSRIFSSSE